MSQTGLVAFFDILGYQDIINNNLIDDVAKIISEIILGLPADAKQMMMLVAGEEKKALVEKYVSKINARIISDSIILACEIPTNMSKPLISNHQNIFLYYVASLLFKSFDKGLPLRGAVDYGDFFLTEQCFAGKPLVDCYRLSNDLQFAGCVLTKNAENRFNEFCREEMKRTFLDQHLKPYLVSLKNREERMVVINWWSHIEIGQRKDIRQYIVNQFKAHNKDISEKVMGKLNNTEVLMRCFI